MTLHLVAHPELRRPVRVGARSTRTGTPGRKIAPNDVKSFPASVPLYDAGTLRTFFLTFERGDWEQELAAFYHTDVLLPATLVVDGKTYHDVGVSFRGNNSFTAVPEGLKRPLSLTLDFVHDQHLLGQRSLNLLNANQDPTFLRSVLFLDVARDYIPAVKANFARVAINGESWGLYVNQQTFSREFLQETFKTSKGTRWKSPNNSTGGGWSYGSDFNIYLNDKGRFLLTLHDANEGFRAGGRAGGAQPEPMTALDDPNKALRHKMLVVPALRDRYLTYVGDIAGKWLDWNRLGPVVERYQKLIAEDVARDTRKLDTIEAFTTGIYGPGDGTPAPATTIKGFAEQRRAALLAHPDIARVRQR